MKAEVKPTVEIDLEIDAYIPDTYIKDGHQKIEMYKRFRGASIHWRILKSFKKKCLIALVNILRKWHYLFQIAEMKVYALLAWSRAD